MSVFFARLDENNIVDLVTVIGSDSDNTFDDDAMIAHLRSTTGPSDSNWVRCCKHGRIKKNFPTIGYTFDASKDAFIPPQPFPSWTLNDETCDWDPPIPRPRNYANEPAHYWNEEIGNWSSPDVPEYIWNENLNNWTPNY